MTHFQKVSVASTVVCNTRIEKKATALLSVVWNRWRLQVKRKYALKFSGGSPVELEKVRKKEESAQNIIAVVVSRLMILFRVFACWFAF